MLYLYCDEQSLLPEKNVTVIRFDEGELVKAMAKTIKDITTEKQIAERNRRELTVYAFHSFGIYLFGAFILHSQNDVLIYLGFPLLVVLVERITERLIKMWHMTPKDISGIFEIGFAKCYQRILINIALWAIIVAAVKLL
ncbi:hypothetical protein FACS1894133_5970 [Clostridia bacterium]|nr:hypothetical protein FACS1894133_5970 [Clostridia bacterium]